MPTNCSAHTAFIAENKIAKQIVFDLELPYIEKSKIDSWLSERTPGILDDHYGFKRINIISSTM